MLRLVLDGTEIDLYENESVNLTLQFSDVSDINATKGSFSQTFRVPATTNNIDFFGYVHEPSAVETINLKQKIPAELISGSVPVVRGFCQVKAVYIQKKQYADIELVFFGETIDLKSAIGDGMLSDLDLSAYDHLLNYTNVQASWSGVGIGPEIRYGLIDKGFNWTEANPPWTPTDGLWQGELTPFMQVTKILDAILDEAGFTYESDFFENPPGAGGTDKMYMPLYNGQQAPSNDDQLDNTCRVGLAVDLQGPDSLSRLAFRDDIDGATNAEGNWDNTTKRYTAPYTGYYSMRFHISQRAVAGGGITKVYVYKNGVSLGQLHEFNLGYPTEVLTTFDGTGSVYDTSGNLINQGPFLLESGDYIEFFYEINNSNKYILADGSSYYTGTVPAPAVGNTYNTYLEVFEVSGALSGLDVDISANMPEIKQIDFLQGLQKMFNLVFIPDKNRPKHLIIEPFQDYIETGTQKDWSSFVDYDKDITLTPTTDLQAKQYEWTYLPGTDFLSDAIQKSLERVYGRFRITEPNNDFAQGEQKVQPPFGQYMTSMVPGTSKPIHRSLQADGTKIEQPLPMIAYWHGLSLNFGEFYLRNDVGVTQGPLFFFPSFSNYSDSNPTLTDSDLNYGLESAFFPITANPVNTLYVKYWAQYVAELYSEEARIMTCTMRLTRTEIANFEFSDNIYIKDSYWRVLKLSYDANVEGVCEVTLLKILSDISPCEDVPTGYATSRANFILFNDSTETSPDFGSKACCEYYGYQWVRNQASIPPASPAYVCKPRTQQTPPTEPTS